MRGGASPPTAASEPYISSCRVSFAACGHSEGKCGGGGSVWKVVNHCQRGHCRSLRQICCLAMCDAPPPSI